jgi:hypothetical protein
MVSKSSLLDEQGKAIGHIQRNTVVHMRIQEELAVNWVFRESS